MSCQHQSSGATRQFGYQRHYGDHIKNDQSWEFVGIYSDAGSGTTAKCRKGFNAMVSVCRRGEADIILVKLAQRFARNTVNALETLRRLSRWKVDIYFEREDIHSLHVIAGNHEAIVKGDCDTIRSKAMPEVEVRVDKYFETIKPI